MKELDEILEWTIHNGIMACNENSKRKILAKAKTAIIIALMKKFDVEKMKKIIIRKAVQTHCELGSDNLSTWKCSTTDLAQSIKDFAEKELKK